MRQVWSYRFALALGVPLLLSLLVVFLFLGGGSTSKFQSSTTHLANYAASVGTVQADSDWQVSNGTTTATARLALDDGRTLYIADGTPGEITCVDFSTPNACVLIAEMLGDAAVWFVLTPAVGDDPLTRLPVPPIVDMLEGGDYAVLQNDWIIPLAVPTKRNCDTATVSLREFINKFGDAMKVSLNLIDDEIDVVTCGTR